MAWPKGVSRKGYTKKNGEPHAPKKDSRVEVLRPVVAVNPKPVVSRKKVLEPNVSEVPQEAPTLHGMIGNGAINAPCPNCLYAYADGGYCPDCGWSKPVVLDEYGTNSGRRF